VANRTIRTLKCRRLFLADLAATGNVEAACLAVGVGRSAMYAWRREDSDFAAEWDAAITAVVDRVEAKLVDQALHDEGPAGVTSRIFLLRHQRAATYNPGMLVRHEAMRLAMEEKRQQLQLGGPVIDGQVERNGKMLSEMDFIAVTALPSNLRDNSPHLPPNFDPDEWWSEHPGEPLPFVPVPQSDAALAMPLPANVILDFHDGTDPELVSSMMADDHEVPPDCSTTLWARVKAYNTGLALLRGAVDPQGMGLHPPQAAEPTPSPDDDPGPATLTPDDGPSGPDAPPDDEVDYTGGFGRP
jgi:hypothetical protein